jgi:hypothetical protein
MTPEEIDHKIKWAIVHIREGANEDATSRIKELIVEAEKRGVERILKKLESIPCLQHINCNGQDQECCEGPFVAESLRNGGVYK